MAEVIETRPRVSKDDSKQESKSSKSKQTKENKKDTKGDKKNKEALAASELDYYVHYSECKCR